MQRQKLKLVLSVLVGVGIVAATAWWSAQYESSPSSLQAETDVERVLNREESAEDAVFNKVDSNERAWQRRFSWENGDDAEVVTRRFKAANDCLLYHSARNELSAILNDERLGDLSNETLATLEDLDAISSRYASIVRETEKSCIGSDRKALAQAYVDDVFKAALLGSPDAQSCFVISNVSPLEVISDSKYRFLEDRYLEHAPIFTENALKRFDPYVAEQVLNRYIASPGVHPSRLESMPKPDPYLTWQMARLASLRALPEQRARIEEKLALFEEQQSLQADDIKRADVLAETVYEREFSGYSPIDLDRQAPCYSSSTLAH